MEKKTLDIKREREEEPKGKKNKHIPSPFSCISHSNMLSFLTVFFFIIVGHLVNSSPITKRNSYRGRATWFIPSKHGGSWGACRRFEADDAIVVAMNADQYGNMNEVSETCGRSVRIWHRGRSTTAVVNDACPKCNYGDLDLTPPVFRALGAQNVGVLDIRWEFV